MIGFLGLLALAPALGATVLTAEIPAGQEQTDADEGYDLYLRRLPDSQALRLTDHLNSPEGFGGTIRDATLSPDGKRVLILASKTDADSLRWGARTGYSPYYGLKVWLLDIESKKLTCVTTGKENAWARMEWSPDGKRFMAEAVGDGQPGIHVAETLYLWDTSTLKRINLAHAETVDWCSWTADGKGVLYRCVTPNKPAPLMWKSLEPVQPPKPLMEPSGRFRVSAGPKNKFVILDDQGMTIFTGERQLFRERLPGLQTLADLDRHVLWSPSGAKAALFLEWAKKPGSLWLLDVDKGASPLTPLPGDGMPFAWVNGEKDLALIQKSEEGENFRYLVAANGQTLLDATLSSQAIPLEIKVGTR